MKHLFILLAIFASLRSFAQSNDASTKELITTIHQCIEATSINSNTLHRAPADYLYHEDKSIKGQRFLSVGMPDKYSTIIITEPKTATPATAQWDERKINLTWENGVLKKIKIEYGDEYVFKKAEGSKVATFGRPIGTDKTLIYVTVVNKEGKISEMQMFEKSRYESKVKTRGLKELNYLADGTLEVNNISYKLSVAPTEKDIISTMKSVYTISGDIYADDFSQVSGKKPAFKEKRLFTYYKDNKLATQEVISYKENKKFKTYNFYLKNELFKTILDVSDFNDLLERKDITLHFDSPDQNDKLPVYEKKKGRYTLNNQSELIYESNGTMYREKVNGAWGEWKYHSM